MFFLSQAFSPAFRAFVTLQQHLKHTLTLFTEGKILDWMKDFHTGNSVLNCVKSRCNFASLLFSQPILEEHHNFPLSGETAAWFLDRKSKVFVNVCSSTTVLYIIISSTHLHTSQGRGKQIKIKDGSKSKQPEIWSRLEHSTKLPARLVRAVHVLYRSVHETCLF